MPIGKQLNNNILNYGLLIITSDKLNKYLSTLKQNIEIKTILKKN